MFMCNVTTRKKKNRKTCFFATWAFNLTAYLQGTASTSTLEKDLKTERLYVEKIFQALPKITKINPFSMIIPHINHACCSDLLNFHKTWHSSQDSGPHSSQHCRIRAKFILDGILRSCHTGWMETTQTSTNKSEATHHPRVIRANYASLDLIKKKKSGHSKIRTLTNTVAKRGGNLVM